MVFKTVLHSAFTRAKIIKTYKTDSILEVTFNTTAIKTLEIVSVTVVLKTYTLRTSYATNKCDKKRWTHMNTHLIKTYYYIILKELYKE